MQKATMKCPRCHKYIEPFICYNERGMYYECPWSDCHEQFGEQFSQATKNIGKNSCGINHETIHFNSDECPLCKFIKQKGENNEKVL